MSAGNNLPTDTEVLFFALQIVQRAETAAEAKVWAQEVLRFSGGSTEADVWPPPGAAEWQGKGSKPAPLYARMEKAYKSVWGFWELESICLAIRAWRGAGQCDDLEPHHLYSHKVKTHLGDCNGHLRNIIIKAMVAAATEHLQAELEDDLAEFSSFDRVTVDVGDLIYRVYKELHPSGLACS